MGVECKSVILVGIPYSKATWDNLTDEVKNDLIDEEIHKSPIDPYDSDIGAERDEFAEQAKEDEKLAEFLIGEFGVQHFANTELFKKIL